jgi:hypothetical protein
MCRCAISAGQGSDRVTPVVCQEVWSFDDEAGIVRLEGLQALCPEVHLAKHVLVQVDDKQRQTAMWTLQAMNECAASHPLLQLRTFAYNLNYHSLKISSCALANDKWLGFLQWFTRYLQHCMNLCKE